MEVFMRHLSLITQVWRSEPVTLGVAFEAAILCDISQGLSYTWGLRNSAGLGVALPPAVSTHRQTLTIPGYFLEPGNYTALAKVGRGPTMPPAQAASHFPPPSKRPVPGTADPQTRLRFFKSVIRLGARKGA